MERAEMERRRAELMALRDRTVGEVSSLERESLNRSPRDLAGDLSGYSIHLADAASDSYERDVSLSLASHEQDLLKRIDRALLKIDEGTYGRCELCGCGISPARLDAVPYAELCLTCKQREENGGGGR